MLEFAEGVALVTGGGSGIGRATALMLAGLGIPVAVADIDRVRADETAHAITERSGEASAVSIDVRDRASVDLAFQTVESWKTSVSILVNSAGILRIEPFDSFTAETFSAVMEINVTGSFHCAQRAAPAMKSRTYGRIINLSSVSGYRAGVGRTAYGTSKAAVQGLTRQLALELGRHGITANAIAPGATVTAMTEAAYTIDTKRSILPMIPSGFLAKPEDIASSIVFLASKQARYINGHVLVVDGGYLASGMLQTGRLEV